MLSTLARLRARRTVLAMAAMGVAIAGCDPRDLENKAVLKDLNDATVKAVTADPLPKADVPAEPGTAAAPAAPLSNDPAALDAPRQAAAAAAAHGGADPALLAVAHGAAGQLDVLAARAAYGKLVGVEQQIRRDLSALRALATQVALSNYVVDGYKKQNPADTLAGIKKVVAAIQGGSEPTWSPGGDLKVMTIAAAEAEVKRLEGEVAAHKAETEKLTADRAAAVAEAEEKAKAADAAKGRAAVDTFKQSADARVRADKIAIQGDDVAEKLKRAEADLAVAKDVAAKLKGESDDPKKVGGVLALQKQAELYEARWKALGDRSAAQRKLAGEIYQGGQGQTIDKLLISVNDLTNQAAELRRDVGDRLTEADKKFLDASAAGKKISSDIAEMGTLTPEAKKGWDALRASVHPNSFLLHQGAVQRERGMLSAGEAALLSDIEATRALVKTALAGAELSAPEVPGVENARLKEIVTAAQEAFDASVVTLQSCESGDAPKDVKNAAMVSRLVTYAAMEQLQAIRQAMGDTTPSKAASDLKEEATRLKNQILEAKLPLPNLPGELGKAPTPATAPAPGAAPAPAGSPPADPSAPPAETPAPPAGGPAAMAE